MLEGFLNVVRDVVVSGSAGSVVDRSPVEPLLFSSLPSCVCFVKKSLMEDGFIPLKDVIGKLMMLALDWGHMSLSGGLEVEAQTNMSCRFCDLRYAFNTCLWCKKVVLWLLPSRSQFCLTTMGRVSVCGLKVDTNMILSCSSFGGLGEESRRLFRSILLAFT